MFAFWDRAANWVKDEFHIGPNKEFKGLTPQGAPLKILVDFQFGK
jgi:hypothetical protein